VVEVSFTSNLERHLSCPLVEAAGDTVEAVLDHVFEDNPRLRSYLLDDQGHLRKHVNIFINGKMLADRTCLSDGLGPDDKVFVIQALSGG